MERTVLFGLLTALALGGGCKKDKGDKEGKAPDSPTGKTDGPSGAETPPQPPPASGDLLATVESCSAAFAAWDKDVYRACFAEKTKVGMIDAVPPQPMATTPKEVLVQVGVFRNAFPDFKAEMQLILVSGRKAATVGLLSGTHGGRSLGMPPTNKPLNMFSAQTLQFDDADHIVDERDFIDHATLLNQLGVLETAGSPAKETPWPEKVRVTAKDDATEKANLAAFQTSSAAEAKGDYAAAASIYADDAVFRFMPSTDETKGRAAIEKSKKDYAAANQDFKITITDAWAAGNWVVAEAITKGTMANDLAGAEGTKGKTWEQTSLELLEFADGKVKRHLSFGNGLKFAADVGLFDPAAMSGGN